MNILEEIISKKKVEISQHKNKYTIDFFNKKIENNKIKKRSLNNALCLSSTGIIAEFKRKSPSKGWIKQNAIETEIIPAYVKNGATAISILTDSQYFGGSLSDMENVRPLVDIPLLRKDFIIEEYQLYQAKAYGADVILLIASALTIERCKQLAKKAQELSMEVLLEIHTEQELDYINDYIDIVGINNRNLSTFTTDIQTSVSLGAKIPDNFTKISESGLSSPKTLLDLREIGFKGFLMGETFMKTPDPSKALADLIKKLI